MVTPRELRDPIHGFIQRGETEEVLIDTPVFQRLRRIKQLAMAHLVYPGAMHTRFDHSIGVMHVAGRMASHLLRDGEVTGRVRIAALLHDLGHGPFSHVSETILHKYARSDYLMNASTSKVHEQITCRIIERCKEIANCIAATEREKIIGILSGKGDEAIVREIISGPLDADKQDYLLRDSYFCGVKYGIFDSDRLVSTLTSFDDAHERMLATTRDGVYAIEQFIISKYHMTMQVYRHKTRLITDAMIVRALELGIDEDKFQWLRDLYCFEDNEEYVNNYLQWDDERVSHALLFEKSGHAKDIFRRLLDRHLFKRICRAPIRAEVFSPQVRKMLVELGQNREACTTAEERIAEELNSKYNQNVDPKLVIIETLTIKSVWEQSNQDEGSIIVLSEGERRKFEDESTFFRSIKGEEHDELIEVYAPVHFADETVKKKKRRELNEVVCDILIDVLSEKKKDNRR